MSKPIAVVVCKNEIYFKSYGWQEVTLLSLIPSFTQQFLLPLIKPICLSTLKCVDIRLSSDTMKLKWFFKNVISKFAQHVINLWNNLFTSMKTELEGLQLKTKG